MDQFNASVEDIIETAPASASENATVTATATASENAPENATVTAPENATATAPEIEDNIEDNIEKSVEENFIKSVEENPPYIYAISDNVGYVGSFYSISDIGDVVRTFPLMKFVVHCFKTSKEIEDLFTIWVILYHTIDAVAYVTNSREDAIKVQKAYAKIGLSYEDDIDYWKQPIGLSPSAK